MIVYKAVCLCDKSFNKQSFSNKVFMTLMIIRRIKIRENDSLLRFLTRQYNIPGRFLLCLVQVNTIFLIYKKQTQVHQHRYQGLDTRKCGKVAV